MNWQRAKWRKLFTSGVDVAEVSSAAGRLLFYILVKYASDAGTLFVGKVPEMMGAVLGQRLRAPIRERRIIRRALDDLVMAGLVRQRSDGYAEIVDFHEYLPVKKGDTRPSKFTDEPWCKLYCDETGPFVHLPLLVRGLAAEVLRHCDAEGMINHGGDLAAYLTLGLGHLYPKSHKRAAPLRRCLDLLMADQYIVPDSSAASCRIRNFRRAQPARDAAPSAPLDRPLNAPSAPLDRPLSAPSAPPQRPLSAPSAPPQRPLSAPPLRGKQWQSFNDAWRI